MPRSLILAAMLALGLASPAPAGAALASPAAAAPDIAFERFRLDNGLTVIVHTDRKAPIVAVNIWYHVGGKDEPDGRHEFAHLYEHLMFQGSEHYNDEFFKPFEDVGATDQNGTTSEDRTNYFQNVPTTALDRALWMESDRMGHLLGVIDQARLDEQRGVVQNEKRQRENQPFGLLWDKVSEASFPVGHPYYAPPIAAGELLKDANLDDVKAWFRQYYGAANATLVLAGDIDVATAKAKAQEYFGHIPAGPPLTRHQVWIAPRSDSRRDVMYDRVAQPRIVRAWNVPPTTDPDSELLGIFAQVLGGSAASRLDARLVHRDQLVDSVGAFNQGMEIAGLFAITADVKSGVDPAQVERVLDEELARLLADGPSEAELARARTVVRAGFIRGVERIGGFGGKADVLAECQVFHGDPGCFRAALERISNASALAVRDAARRWLAQGDYTLSVLPFGTFTNTAASAVDRSSGLPAVTQFPDLSFPDLERTTLSNGIPVVLARRPEIPTVQVQAQIDAGYAADAGGKLGTAAFTMGMLDEGAGKLDALAFKARVEDLGAGIGSGASLDTSTVYVSALVDQLDPSLALFADVLRAPRLDAGDIERVRKQWLARIAQEKTQPNAIASRLLPPLLYGAGHSYGIPFTGSGTEASIAALTRADLAAHVATWVRPDNLRLIVVGDTTLAQIVPLLEKHFGDWRAAGVPRGSKSIGAVALPGAPRVFLVDRPEAQQTLILGGHLIPSSKAPDLLQTESAVSALGGLFSARLNMNLREAKHWSYGAYAYTSGARNQRPLLVYAPVQADKTLESLQELLREFNDYVGARPISADELARVVANDVRSLPGSFETAGAVMGAIGGILLYDRPDDWVRTLKARTEAQTLDGVRKAAQDTIKPAAMTWVIVGDLSKIEQPIRDLKLGTVQVMDADGKVLR